MKNLELISADDFFEKYRQLPGHELLTRHMASVKHCSANMFGKCVMGTLLVPDKNDLEKQRLKCGFYMNADRLIIIDDEGRSSKVFEEMAKEESFEIGNPPFMLFGFIEYLLRDDLLYLEEYEKKLDIIEDLVTDEGAEIPEDFSGFMSRHRKNLRTLISYYKLLADVTDVLEAFLAKENDERTRQFFSFLGNKADRLYHDSMAMSEYVLQIRDIHQSRISSQQNKVMQLLTIVTTIFMPLTLIAGWYGMNFRNMPELKLHYGYLAVGILAAVTVIIEIIFFKRKKWF